MRYQGARRAVRLGILSTLILTLTGASAYGAAITFSSDSFENDDTPSAARDVSTVFTGANAAWFGSDPFDRGMTFDSVEDSTAASDDDWISFEVSSADLSGWPYSYLIEAVPNDTGSSPPRVDPVIEVYGPGQPTTWTVPGALGEGEPGVTETDPMAIAADDDGDWFAGRGASTSFIPTEEGTYYARVRPFYMYDGGESPGFREGVGAFTLRLKVGLMTRVSGSDRIGTSIAISKERFRSGESPYAVIASGYSFADALSGSTLAGALDAPMLLTRPASLPTGVESELTRLGVTEVYILGGTGAVSSAVESRLGTLVGSANVHRVAGSGRIQTAAAVAKATDAVEPVSRLAFIANGYTYPDALSASPMATYNVAPILLTRQDTLANITSSTIKDLGITDVVIVGGTGAVSSAVEAQLASLLKGSSHVRRIGGANRYQTSSEFAIWATAAESGDKTVGTSANPTALDALDYSRIGVASGQNYPDALAGGVFCGHAGAPVLLSPRETWSRHIYDYDSPSTRTYYSVGSLAILRSYLFGGEGALADWIHLSGDLITGPAF